MSDYAKKLGAQDAANGRPARDVQNETWKVQQDYNTAYAANKKRN